MSVKTRKASAAPTIDLSAKDELRPQTGNVCPATAAEPADLGDISEALSRVLDARASEFSAKEADSAQEATHSLLELRSAAHVTEDSVDAALLANKSTVLSHFLWTTVPSEPDPEAAPDRKLSTEVYGREVSLTGRLGRGEHATSVSGSVDRLGVGVEATGHGVDGNRFGGLWLMKGWGMAWVGNSRKYENGTARSTAVGPFFDATGGGLYSRHSVRLLSGETLRIGGFAGGNFDRSLKDLGDYSGEDPALKGTRCVELSRDLSGFATATPGISLASALGIGGRIGFSKDRRIRYRTHLAKPKARALLFEKGNKLSRAVRDRARALGLADEPLPPPDLSRPEDLQVGDQVTLTTSGGFSGGLLLGPGFGAYVGAQGAMRGDFELSVHKTDADTVEVTVLPTWVDTLQIAGRAYVIDVATARSTARSMAQRFRFDLRQPEARQAYLGLLKGELPGGGDAKEVRAASAERPAEAELSLPSGVQSGPVERYQGTAHSSHADVGFLWLLLGTTRQHSDYQHEVKLGDTTLHEQVRELRRHTTIPLSGDESRGVRASLLSRTRVDAEGEQRHEFAGLRLLACYTDSKVRGLEFNDDIDDINTTFGLQIGHFSHGALKQARSIELAMMLGPDELSALAQVADAQLREACREADTRPSALLKLVRDLRVRPDAEVRATQVQDYVARQGLAGMGALVRLLGHDQLAITTTPGAVEVFVGQARSLSFKYSEPLAADAPNDQLAARFKEVGQLDEKLQRLDVLLREDPILAPEQKSDLLSQVGQARQQIAKTLDCRHLSAEQRQTLIDQLDRGWTTHWEYQAMNGLLLGRAA